MSDCRTGLLCRTEQNITDIRWLLVSIISLKETCHGSVMVSRGVPELDLLAQNRGLQKVKFQLRKPQTPLPPLFIVITSDNSLFLPIAPRTHDA